MVEATRMRLAAVTGITGFIGGHLAGALARRGWRLRALARSMPQLSINTGPPTPPPVEIVQGDLADVAALARLVEGADAVIHLAGAIKGRSRADFLRANAAGTAALAQAWRDHTPVSRFLLLSSMAAREPGLSHYAASKAAAEAELRRIGAGADWCILRPAAVYGPGDRETLRIFRAAAGPVQPMLNGRAARVTAIHVDDVVDAILALAEIGTPGTEFELTDGNINGYSWDELTEAVARATGRAPRPVRVPAALVRAFGLAGDAAARAGLTGMLTSQKAREILHDDWSSRALAQPPASVWQPRVALADGFAATVQWYREQGWLA